ncbi:MAG: AMP-binding protein [Defluviitaleaceae bacterium]|nr:AMP-binding protein [Defluviitaleaceae bacterium]
MPITEILERNARLYGECEALAELNPDLSAREEPPWKELNLVEVNHHPTYRRKSITWRSFDLQANRCANMLMGKGIKKGDKVAVLMMNSIDWLPVYFGALKTGALAVPLNFRYSADEIKYCLELAGVCALLFGPEFTERVGAIHDGIPGVKHFIFVGDKRQQAPFAENYYGLCADASDEAPPVPLTDADEAAIYFSSGTTGQPKAILHNHRALTFSCEVEQAHHGQTKEDVFLCIPPLYHTGAKMHWFGSLISGGRAVLLRGASPEWIIQAASEERASIVWLLVPWAQDILYAIESGAIRLEDYDLSRWRLMHIGAQPVPPSLVRSWKTYFPEHEYDTNYGLSESIGPGAVHLGVENIHKVGAIGKAGYGWETKIVGGGGDEARRGEVGELAVRGPGVMLCYYHDPKATAETLKDGWLLTGDMAMEDEDGFIFLVDRKKDVIISGGENLYPVQIEDFLHGCDKILDAAVIGLPDRRQGEIAVAIIELKPGQECSEAEIYKFCEGLPRYKRPRRIIFDKVPRNATGKIEKPRLREKYAGGSVVYEQINS